jgi:Aspartyl protease
MFPSPSHRSCRKPRTFGLLLGLLLFCPRATANSIHPQLPSDESMNKGAGRGSWLIVALRLESGEELPFIVDTGSPVTLLDTSLEAKLGKRLETMTFSLPAGGKQESGVYPAPKLYLSSILLATDSCIVTYPFKQLSTRSHQRIMGVLGMDCLRHYCVQLDFQAGKMRFLAPDQVNAAEVGKAFPLTFSNKGQNFPPMFSSSDPNDSLPFIQHAGLLGGTTTNSLIDTGDNVDGAVEKGVIKGHYLTRFVHFLIKFRAVRLRECVWDGETYTKLSVQTGRNANRLGLRFLARHLVTFDFPKQTMYLKQTSIGPLGFGEKR